eukprot:m51a1_g10876 hypothetical protein (648) ;mRNA; r:12170-19493
MASMPVVARIRAASRPTEVARRSGRQYAVTYTPELCAEIRRWASAREDLVNVLRNRCKTGSAARVLVETLCQRADIRERIRRSPLPSGPVIDALIAQPLWAKIAMNCVPESDAVLIRKIGMPREALARLTLVVLWSVHERKAKRTLPPPEIDDEPDPPPKKARQCYSNHNSSRRCYSRCYSSHRCNSNRNSSRSHSRRCYSNRNSSHSKLTDDQVYLMVVDLIVRSDYESLISGPARAALEAAQKHAHIASMAADKKRLEMVESAKKAAQEARGHADRLHNERVMRAGRMRLEALSRIEMSHQEVLARLEKEHSDEIAFADSEYVAKLALADAEREDASREMKKYMERLQHTVIGMLQAKKELLVGSQAASRASTLSLPSGELRDSIAPPKPTHAVRAADENHQEEKGRDLQEPVGVKVNVVVVEPGPAAASTPVVLCCGLLRTGWLTTRWAVLTDTELVLFKGSSEAKAKPKAVRRRIPLVTATVTLTKDKPKTFKVLSPEGDLCASVTTDIRRDIFYTAHDVAGALKAFLREMPEPPLTHDGWLCLTTGPLDRQSVREVVAWLPDAHRCLVTFLLHVFVPAIVQHSAANKMTAPILAKVLAPCLLRPRDDKHALPVAENLLANITRCEEVMRLMITDHNAIFTRL